MLRNEQLNKILIEIKDFSKSFGKKMVHKSINFTLFDHEVLGLLGGSGSGKSVLLRSLIGLEFPDHGDIFLFEKNTKYFNENDWNHYRKIISYSFQGGALFDSMTVFENLAFPLREHTSFDEKIIYELVTKTLNEFNLIDAIEKYPNQLSGGMQKRVGLARSIMLNPKIILYDEPTAGLDPANTAMVKQMIMQLKEKGVSGILVTHDMPVAFDVCDRIALLNEGKILIISSPKDIIKDELHPILKFSKGLTIV